jgi:virginiamycin B lyase
VALGIAASAPAAAQAYIYWTISGPFANGGTALGRADLDASGITHTFVTGADNPSALAIDGSYIYWSNFGDSAIGRARLDGSDPDPTWINDLPQPANGLAVDGSYVYWTSQTTGYIGRATIGGADVTPDFIDVGPDTDPEGLAIDPATDTLYIGTAGQIDSVLATGGPVSRVGQSLGTEVQVLSLAITGGEVYYGVFDNDVGSVASMTTQGQYPTTLVDDLRYPGGVATDGTYLYWTDLFSGDIGRALLVPSGVSNIDYDFISEPSTPFGIAVDAGIDPTTTTVSCVPSTVPLEQPSACTATVADSASTSTPAGTVDFTGSRGAFFLGSPCTLAPDPGAGASCTLGGELTTWGNQTITASYSGDPVHEPSSGSAGLCAGTATQCGGAPPPPPPPPNKPACIVPKLKGETLSQARATLRKAHCTLGKVKKPKNSHGKLKVSSSKPVAGKKLADGSKITVTLVARRHRR